MSEKPSNCTLSNEDYNRLKNAQRELKMFRAWYDTANTEKAMKAGLFLYSQEILTLIFTGLDIMIDATGLDEKQVMLGTLIVNELHRRDAEKN